MSPPKCGIAIVLDNFSPHLTIKTDRRVGDWAEANNVELAHTPKYSSWLNWIQAQFTALGRFSVDGTDHHPPRSGFTHPVGGPSPVRSFRGPVRQPRCGRVDGKLRAWRKFPPEAIAREQAKRAAAASSGRSAETVYGGHEHALRQTVLALTAGSSLDEHESPGDAIIQVLRGRSD
jgi:hypothetical protein